VADDPKPTPTQQVLRCARLLREGWHDKASLSRRLGVSERAIKRYLAAIAAEEDGFAIREVDECGLRQYRIRPVGVREGRNAHHYEIAALAMAERFFSAFDPGGVADQLDQLLFEITGEDDESDEGESGRARRSLARRFVLARAPQPLPGTVRHVFDRVLQGVLERRVLILDYRPRRGGERRYVLRPYTLLLGESELAVTGATGEVPDDGRARDDDPIRTFALHRIAGIQLSRQRFEMPNLGQWNPEARFSTAWGLYAGEPERVVVAVHPAFEDLVAARRWHGSQQALPPADDGWLRLGFDVFPHGELRTWVLGWGPWLRVEEPAALADWVEQARAATVGEGEPEADELYRIP
jgi:predicted DNA-binding transcriptional regulator YafY